MPTYVSKSVADIKASFPVHSLKQISPVNIDTLMEAIKVINRCARSVPSNCGNYGYLFLSISPEGYATYDPTPPTLPVRPPIAPPYTDAMSDADREACKLDWEVNKMEWENIRNMNQALINLLFEALPDDYKLDLESDFIGQANVTFLQMFDSLLDKYGRIDAK